MSTSSGGRSADCPKSSLQYCPLSQLEKLERIADEIRQPCRVAAETAAHIKGITADMRRQGLVCASGCCRFLAKP
ncbi:MAG: hypothetical protein Kow00114_13540 [Kiloniellaceae bacterium]